MKKYVVSSYSSNPAIKVAQQGEEAKALADSIFAFLETINPQYFTDKQRNEIYNGAVALKNVGDNMIYGYDD